jgi:hypothetical protein
MDEEVGTGVDSSERAHHAGGGGSTPERRRRMSARRKQDAVLRLLRGEDLELLSRQLGVTAADLSGWREAFLAGGEASLKSRPGVVTLTAAGRARGRACGFASPHAVTWAHVTSNQIPRAAAR